MTAPRRGRPEASAAVWRWDERDEDRGPSAASQRRAGVLRAGVRIAAGAALFYFDRPTVATIAWSLAGLTLALALASPLGAYAALDRAVGRLGRAVGVALTWLLLAPAYFLILTPLGLAIRLRRDPLRRALERDRESYWDARADRPLDRPY